MTSIHLGLASQSADVVVTLLITDSSYLFICCVLTRFLFSECVSVSECESMIIEAEMSTRAYSVVSVLSTCSLRWSHVSSIFVIISKLVSGIPTTVRGIIRSKLDPGSNDIGWFLGSVLVLWARDDYNIYQVYISVQIVDCFITGLDREHEYYTPSCQSYDLFLEYSIARIRILWEIRIRQSDVLWNLFIVKSLSESLCQNIM